MNTSVRSLDKHSLLSPEHACIQYYSMTEDGMYNQKHSAVTQKSLDFIFAITQQF